LETTAGWTSMGWGPDARQVCVEKTAESQVPIVKKGVWEIKGLLAMTKKINSNVRRSSNRQRAGTRRALVDLRTQRAKETRGERRKRRDEFDSENTRRKRAPFTSNFATKKRNNVVEKIRASTPQRGEKRINSGHSNPYCCSSGSSGEEKKRRKGKRA